MFGETKDKSSNSPKHQNRRMPPGNRGRSNPFSKDEGIPLEDLRLGRDLEMRSASSSSLVTSNENLNPPVEGSHLSLSFQSSARRTSSPLRSVSMSPAIVRASKRNPSETEGDQSDCSSTVSSLLFQSHIEAVPVAVATAFDSASESDSDPLSGKLSVTPVKTPNNTSVSSVGQSNVGVDEVGLEMLEVELTEGIRLCDDEAQLSSLQCFGPRPKSRKPTIQEI